MTVFILFHHILNVNMTSRTSSPSKPHPKRRRFAEASSAIVQDLEEEINANALDDIALQTGQTRKTLQVTIVSRC